MIYQLLKTKADDAPDNVALCAPGRADLTYQALISQIELVINALIAKGVHAGSPVAVVLPNGPEMASAILGTTAMAICAPLNPTSSRDEFDFYFSDINPIALITMSGMNSPAIEIAKRRDIAVIELAPALAAPAGIFTISGVEQTLGLDFNFPGNNDCALLLHTSGTTSRPKMVPLTHENLLASCQNITRTLRLTETDRCLNVMPLFHIHGLVGALLSSLMAGASVVCASTFNVEKFFAWLYRFRPTWYTAVPTIHHAVLSAAQTDRRALGNNSLRFIRSSSSALPNHLMEGLEQIFKVPVIESYGMTEAAHQMASNPIPPGTRKPGSVGVAAGPEIAVIDETGKLLPKGETGEIVIRGANVMNGYANNSDANNASFTQGWFKTGDQGYLDQDGYLFITGRLKEIINRGGEKIAPREVEDAILQHPAVAQAVAFAVPHPTLGEDIAAAIVPRPQSQASVREIREFAATKLADFKVPSQIVVVDTIPLGATGKITRKGLAQTLADQLRSEHRAAQNELQEAVADIFGEVIGVEHVSVTDNFFALGGDSLRASQVLNRIRAKFDVNLTIATIFQKSTVAEFADEISLAIRNTDSG